MLNRFRVVGFLIGLWLVAATAVGAQGEPPQVIDAALADLSERVGAALTLEDPRLFWSWAEQEFSDTSLGCPQPDEMYAQVITPGFQFLFTFEGTIYDYRASQDGQIVLLCSSSPAPEVTPEATVAAPVPVESPASAITAANAVSVVPVAVVEGEFAAPLVWSPTGRQLVVVALPDAAAPDVGRLLLFDAGALDAPPTVLETDGAVTALAYHFADPVAYLVTGGAGGEVKIFPVEPEGSDILPMLTEAGQPSINAVAINGEGTVIASASGAADIAGSNTLRLWNATTGKLIAAVDADSPATSAAFSPDGQTVAFGTESGAVMLVDAGAPNARQPRVLGEHTEAARDLAFSPDGGWLASVSLDGTATLWDLNGINAPRIFEHDADVDVLAVSFSPDGSVLATAGGNPTAAEGAVWLWDVGTGALLATLAGSTTPVVDLAFSPDGAQLASVGTDGTLRVWGLPANP